MRIYKRFVGSMGLGATLLAIPQFCFAQFCPSMTTGAGALCLFIQRHILSEALIAFYGIAAAAIFYYGVRMIVESYNENAYSNVKNSFVFVFCGFCVIAISMAFANSFYLTTSPVLLSGGLNSIIAFILSGAAGVFVLIVVIAGLGMITTQGDQAAFDKWTKILRNNCIGVVLMMIAIPIMNAVTRNAPGLIVLQLTGLALFLLTIVGFVCIIALIIAGILLIVSIDESLRERAKNIIIGTLISLVVVIISYTMILTFVI